MLAFGVLATIVILTGPVFAQGFGGGVMATTPSSGINSMATTPGLPPSLTTNGGGKFNATASSQTETSSSGTPGDVVSAEPGQSPPVTSGISRQHEVTGQKRKKATEIYSRPQ